MEKATGRLIEIVNSNWNREEMLNTLKRKLSILTAKEEDINIQLETIESSSSNKKRKHEVANWLANVNTVKERIQDLEADMKKNSWSIFWGDGVKRLTDEVNELIGESEFQGGLVLEVCETKAKPLLVTKLYGKAFKDNQRKVLEWLTKDEVLRIGIYGMGGVGKTTLVTHIYNQLLKGQNRSSNIYWITVSQDFNICKLQDRIAQEIKFNFDGENEERKRAVKISEALEKKQKSIIILDDLWHQFSLEEIGIPMGCKLIMTTRSLEICRMMSCHEKIKLVPLFEEESWNLFVEKLGDYATLSSEIKEIAKLVVGECDGLPLGIVTLAGSMRGVDDVREWKSVLEQLKNSIIEPGEMDDKVFKVLNLSYERLRDPTLQECFLYCALFPEDSKIEREVLIEYLISENIIKDLYSRQAQFDRGHTLLNKLENACLLEGSSPYSGSCVKMHDLIRDMAINKMKRNPKAMVKAGERLKEIPYVIEWSKDLVRVSLMKNYIKEIPEGHSPSCPNLSTLLLRDNSSLEFVADSFFFQFCGLKVLDLSETGIKVLPNSVSNLPSLTSLLLRGCRRLWYIPSLAALQTLKRLDLRECQSVEVAPGGLELLSNLQYLDMLDTQIEDIPNGLLPNLSHVQYLSLNWSAAVEVKSACLEKAEHLECRFLKPQHFNSMMKDSHEGPLLSNYRLLIGEFNDHISQMYMDEELFLSDKLVVYNVCDIGKDGDLVRIPKDGDLELFIFECHSLRSLDNACLPIGAEEVRIERCDGLEYLISLYRPPSLSSSSAPFDHVKQLLLEDLKNLRDLISREGAPPPSFQPGGVFSCLLCLDIWKCPSITTLFPYELWPNLQNLEELIVHSCEKLKQIIGDEESNSDSHTEFIISLPKFGRIEFRDLPELKSVCSKKVACDSMERIWIEDCPKLKRMALSLIQLDNGQPSPLPSLLGIWISSAEWWVSVELDPPNAKDILQPLVHNSPC